ncbi:5'-methylthioadenosine/S-adenosylhomocysteine nucleosidase [Ureaplasma canigenitalium]|uniref:5'-methylthioadenosine/S-adenosylhomocysteine nucleosidase n=1 Tax=Ureaplasma canigenitalium TaxID=42092 RepID=UPI0004E23D64|nr:5'-methylthioadenosine/S-adenosylhomocysteine nucleosidase [Ureaplasma canigenitalium]
MIGMVVALKSEIKNFFENKIKSKKFYKEGGIDFYLFKVKYYDREQKVVLCFSDVGKVNAAHATSIMINTFKPFIILNVGSSCSIKKDDQPLTLYLIEQTKYLDVDVSAFGYELNQVPRQPTIFWCQKDVFSFVDPILKNSGVILKYGNVGTIDKFIHKDNISNLPCTKNIDLIDMELASIAQVCHKMNTGFVSLKMVSDTIYNDEKSSDQFNQNMDAINKWFENHLFSIIEAISVYKNKLN